MAVISVSAYHPTHQNQETVTRPARGAWRGPGMTVCRMVREGCVGVIMIPGSDPTGARGARAQLKRSDEP